MAGGQLVSRAVYLSRALMFRDTALIKVVTGVRRCGKSGMRLLRFGTHRLRALVSPSYPRRIAESRQWKAWRRVKSARLREVGHRQIERKWHFCQNHSKKTTGR